MQKNKKAKIININDGIALKAETDEGNFKAKVKHFSELMILTLSALVIGIVTGFADGLFGTVLLKITDFRTDYSAVLLPFLGFAGLLIVFVYEHFGKGTQKGMTLLFEKYQNPKTDIPLRLIPFVTFGTWITHLFGGSAGREGVAVQIGGTLGAFVSQKVKTENSGKILMIAGMSAGFGGLFRTPAAAVFFAIEVLYAGKLEIDALLPSLTAAYTASFVSGFLGLEKFTAVLESNIEPNVHFITAVCIAGITFGIMGGFFAFALGKTKKLLAEKLKNPYIRISVCGAVISIISLILWCGRYSGLGTNIISAAFSGGEVYVWDFAVKLALTILTLSAGFQGGEVTPLFSIGASLGVVIAMIFNVPTMFFAALGYAAVFGSATNTLIAPMLIGAEVFGYQYFPYFFVVCILAYIFNGNNCIYSMQVRK